MSKGFAGTKEPGKSGMEMVVRMLLWDMVRSRPSDSSERDSGDSEVGVESSDCRHAESEVLNLSSRLGRDEGTLLAVDGGVGNSRKDLDWIGVWSRNPGVKFGYGS